MLSPSEIKKLLNKKEVVLADREIMAKAQDWDLVSKDISPQLIATVYTYMNIKYQIGESLDDIEIGMGIAKESVSRAIKELEGHGYLTVSRGTKPFRYVVVK